MPESYPSIELDRIKKEGWSKSSHPRFRYAGEIAYLCPECTKQWEAEKRMYIECLINQAKEVTDFEKYRDYLMELTRLEASHFDRSRFLEATPIMQNYCSKSFEEILKSVGITE